MEKPMVQRDCTTCKYDQLSNRKDPCSPCSTLVIFGNWEPKETKEIERGCATCKHSKVVTGTPCLMGGCFRDTRYHRYEPVDTLSQLAEGRINELPTGTIIPCASVKNFLDEQFQKTTLDALHDAFRVPEQIIVNAPQPILEGSAASSKHYQVGAIQPIEYLQMVLTPEEFQGFCKGNIIKYSSRCGHKDKPSKEAAKSEQYSKWLRMSLEGQTINPREDK